jgi:hypothetical protein
MLFVGLALPLVVGWWALGKTKADRALVLLGLVSLPLLVWAASLGLKIGPCDVPECMSSTQHSHYIFSIIGLVVVLAGFVVLSREQRVAGGILVVIGQLLGAYSMIHTDTASLITFLILAAAAGGYLYVRYRLAHEADSRVPDFPPTA